MRLTKIVCTLGPASNSPENIEKMIHAGMNVARINFSHGDGETHASTIHAVKKIAEANGYDIPTMLDTKGPEIRTGDVAAPIAVKKGEDVLFTFDKKATYDGTIVHVNYPEFGKDALKAEAIIVDNGDMAFTLVKSNPDGSVILKAQQDGMIGNRRHVNLPGADVSLPSITEKDWKDLEFGVQEKMDYVALSFIRTAADVEEVRAFLKKKGSEMKIISKIENRASVQNIGEIIDASDGIMVARGDLGAEMPFQKIPAVQDMIVRMCRAAGKPVIVATQMLESMIKNPMPTRAEVTDVAHAALTGTDTTMLSGETAAGAYPFESVAAMSSILEETESRMSGGSCGGCDCGRAHDDSAVRAEAAVTMAHSGDASAIVVLCNTGKTAELMSGYRPGVPVFAFSDSPALRRQLAIRFGITPVDITMESDGELNIERALSTLVKKGLAKKKERVVVVARTQVRSGPLVTVHLRNI